METICPKDPMGETVQYNKNVSIVIIFFFSPPSNHLFGKSIIKGSTLFFQSYLGLAEDVDIKIVTSMFH